MTTERIDVLAVMDASAEKITFLAQKTGVYHPATELAEARAAVAELIERERVMREALASVKQWNDVSGLDDEWPIVMGQVDAALARVGAP